MFIMSNFAERLAELMFDNKISKNFIIENFEINRTTLNRYLNGSRMPSLPLLIQFADLFNCSLDYLLGRTENNYATKYKKCPPFSEQLTIFLNENKTNKSQFQIKTQISESIIYDWHFGRHIPNIYNIIKIADCYECSTDFVVGRE